MIRAWARRFFASSNAVAISSGRRTIRDWMLAPSDRAADSEAVRSRSSLPGSRRSATRASPGTASLSNCTRYPSSRSPCLNASTRGSGGPPERSTPIRATLPDCCACVTDGAANNPKENQVTNDRRSITESTHEGGECHVERACDAVEGVEIRRMQRALEARQRHAVEAGLFRQRLLREAARLAQGDDPSSHALSGGGHDGVY